MQRKTVSLACETFIGGDSFVQVMDAKIDGLQKQAHLQIYVMNLHSFTLTGLEYEAVFYNSANVKINDTPHKFKAENINIETSQINLAADTDITQIFPKASRASIKLLKGYFSDSNELDLEYDNMESVTLESLDPRDTNMLKQVAGDDAYSLSRRNKLSWRCVCGYFNSDDSVFCSNCAREKDHVLNKYNSMDQIKPMAAEEEVEDGDLNNPREMFDDTNEDSENLKVKSKAPKPPKVKLPKVNFPKLNLPKIESPDLDPFFASFEDMPKFIWIIGLASLAFMLITFIILLIYRY